jgi:hypothetical protein
MRRLLEKVNKVAAKSRYLGVNILNLMKEVMDMRVK